MVPNFLFTNSMLLPSQEQPEYKVLLFIKNFPLAHISLEITYEVNKVGPCKLLPHYFPSFRKSPESHLYEKACWWNFALKRWKIVGSEAFPNEKLLDSKKIWMRIIIIMIIMLNKMVTITVKKLGTIIFNNFRFCFLIKEAMFLSTKIGILVSEYSEWSKASINMIFSWRPDVCVCVCAGLSNFQTTIIHKRLEISS